MWGWQAVGSAESGCRGVVQWWGEGLVGERAAAYEAIEVSSRRFEIHVYDPERTELELSGVEDEALPDLVGKFDAVEGNTLRALGMLRDRPADHEKAVRESPRACWAERRTSAPTLRSCSMGQPTGKKPGRCQRRPKIDPFSTRGQFSDDADSRIVESVVRLCE